MDVISRFQGISGALYVTVVAFSIVFGVLLILTGMIYAMKLFAGAEKPKGGAAQPAAAVRPAPVAAAPVKAVNQAKIVAAITAAILMATGGRGRVLSIAPAAGDGVSVSTWRTSGVVALVNNNICRPWSR